MKTVNNEDKDMLNVRIEQLESGHFVCYSYYTKGFIGTTYDSFLAAHEAAKAHIRTMVR